MALIKLNTRSIPDDAVTPAKVSQNLGRRNIIINGDMRVAQRATTSTFADGDKGYKTVDRWKIWEQGAPGSAYSMTIGDGPDGFSSSHKLTCTTAETTPAATVHMYTLQNIEGKDLQSAGFGTSAAKTLTCSFWVKSSLTGTYAVVFKQITSDAAVYYYGDNYTIGTANTWQKVTIAIPKNTVANIVNDASIGFSCDFIVVSGTNYSSGTKLSSWTVSPGASSIEAGHTANLGATVGNTWQITGVQLELGSVATDFEHRSYAEELVACQRYCHVYQNGGTEAHLGVGAQYNVTAVNIALHLPNSLRVSPTVERILDGSSNWLQQYVGGTSQSSNSVAQIADFSGNTIRLYCPSSITNRTAGEASWCHVKPNAKLILSAEL